MLCLGRTYAKAAERRIQKPYLPYNPQNPFDTPLVSTHPNRAMDLIDLTSDPVVEVSDNDTITVDEYSQHVPSIGLDGAESVHSFSTFSSTMPPPLEPASSQQRKRPHSNISTSVATLEIASKRVQDLQAKVKAARERKAKRLQEEEERLERELRELEG
jgi:hypothetical protein